MELSTKMLLDIPDIDESIEEMLMGDEGIDHHNQLKHSARHCSVVQCLDEAPVNKDLWIH
jgi:hypothetical protein